MHFHKSVIKMSSFPLRERLEELECHFTWGLEDHGQLYIGHLLQKLGIKINHNVYQNQAIFYAMRAYLHQREGRYQDALRSLQEAEDALKAGHQSNFDRSVLVTYGNYAWVYHHLCDYDKVEEYLGKINDINTSLPPPTKPGALIPEINAAKGWSLVVLGKRHGEAAAVCFEEALAEDHKNLEFHAGRAMAALAVAINYKSGEANKETAKAKLQEVAYEDPINYELRSCLSQLLRKTNPSEASTLAEDALQNSKNPEVFRNIAHFYKTKDLNRTLEILNMAISLDDNYYLLYRDLGMFYQKQLDTDQRVVTGGQHLDRPEILSNAIKAFKQAIKILPVGVSAKLCLAEIYGRNQQVDFQEEMYANLEADLPTLSQKCQQAFYLSYGKYQLYQKKSLCEAVQLFMKGFQIPYSSTERDQCQRKLSKIAHWFEQGNRRAEAADIKKRIQDPDQAEH